MISMVIIRNLIFTVHFVHGFHFVHPSSGGPNNLHLVRFYVFLVVVNGNAPTLCLPQIRTRKTSAFKAPLFLYYAPDSVACIDRDASYVNPVGADMVLNKLRASGS